MGESPSSIGSTSCRTRPRTNVWPSSKRLEDLGHELRRPEADFLRDGIYELRIGLQGLNYRILYFFHGREAVVVSHGLLKERVVPPRDIDQAVERKERFETDPKRHTFSPET